MLNVLLRVGALTAALSLVVPLGGCTRHLSGTRPPQTQDQVSDTSSPTAPYAPLGKPNESTTGPRSTQLRALDGSRPTRLTEPWASPAGCAYWDGRQVLTTRDGCTVTGVSYSGQFTVRNNDTTLLDDRIVGRGTEDSNDIVVSSNWGSGHFKGTVIERSDIFGSPAGSLYCVAGFDFTLIGDDIRGCSHLFNLYGQDDHVTITGCYLHSPRAAPDDHVELLYASPGASDVRLTGNNWYMTPAGSPTAAVFLDGTNEDSGWVITGNWFDGQDPTSSNWNSIQADTNGITFRDNRIGVHSAYGPYQFNDHPPSASGGNVWMYSASTPSSWPSDVQTVTAGHEVPGI